MPIYTYKAKNSKGEIVKGRVEAKNEQAAASIITKNSLFLIDLKEYRGGFLNISLFNKKPSFRDIVTFTDQLSTMITAGLPLLQALNLLKTQTNEAMNKVLDGIIKIVESGGSFSSALKKFPDVFSNLYIQLVKAGETGGLLDKILQELATNLKKQKELRAKVKGAMIYPIVVILVMVLVVLILMIFVVPGLSKMYLESGVDLPWATKLLISVSNFLAHYFLVIGIFLIVSIFSIRFWYKNTKDGREFFDRLFLKLPIFGNLIAKMTLTDFTRTLGLLLGAGVSLVKSLNIVSKGLSNIIYREAMEQIIKDVERGIPMSEALNRFDVFPPLLYQMISVGEETGNLDEVLKKVSQYYERETAHAVDDLARAMEPMIIVILGVVVGGILFAIMMPIFNLANVVA